MSVSQHLRISIAEYDARIRTFVPYYETMLDVVADALAASAAAAPVIVDLGTGTGALAARCLQLKPTAKLIGIDADAAMLEAARARLGDSANVLLTTGDFLNAPLPACDAIVACIALHHIRAAQAKQAFYARCRAALRPGGVFLNADCLPSRDESVAAQQLVQWRTHLERTYTRAESEAHLTAWADEDTYFPLDDELDWLKTAGLLPEVIWRQEGFAVIRAR